MLYLGILYKTLFMNPISIWHDALVEKHRHRRSVDRRNEYILLITFMILCGALQLPKFMGEPMSSTVLGLILLIAAAWITMLIAAVYHFPPTIEET